MNDQRLPEYNTVKEKIVEWLRVPPQPAPPQGAPGSLHIFRASPKYFKFRILMWKIGAVTGALITLLVFVGLIAAGAATGGWAWLLMPVALVLPALYIVHCFISYLVLRLDYEMRWYMVTDRSLRIREGVYQVREMTMTFANIQNLSISQGPIQKLFGIADLSVQSAGGGAKPRGAAALCRCAHRLLPRGRQCREDSGSNSGSPEGPAGSRAGRSARV